MNKALLLSGGIESTIIAYIYKPDIGITIDYGQVMAESEIKSSKYICKKLNIKHIVLKTEVPLTKHSNYNIDKKEWIPFRNQYLITVSAMHLFSLNIKEIYIGTTLNDSHFKDGSSEFINIINKLFNYQEGNISIVAPFVNKTILQIIDKINIPLNIISIAFSCTESNIPCGNCESCLKNINVIHLLRKKMKETIVL
ncbi:MAG: 7-cyano-7-deazaguanine synthase [Sulfurimonas sp.]|uniref:7-cyano-7-deazaguanine synthase n=1 Tax=Sulfurimonas sp. TaxID=2022749 RepID=UPI00260EA720|nr:7-cyano-7-deazaguanine synthase [Sulfurimonas sp.]MDD5372343.1 7-cyano-7-deazaguanine synthase [Sulfurimonas sp.]